MGSETAEWPIGGSHWWGCSLFSVGILGFCQERARYARYGGNSRYGMQIWNALPSIDECTSGTVPGGNLGSPPLAVRRRCATTLSRSTASPPRRAEQSRVAESRDIPPQSMGPQRLVPLIGQNTSPSRPRIPPHSDLAHSARPTERYPHLARSAVVARKNVAFPAQTGSPCCKNRLREFILPAFLGLGCGRHGKSGERGAAGGHWDLLSAGSRGLCSLFVMSFGAGREAEMRRSWMDWCSYST